MDLEYLMPQCCIACHNENTELHMADDQIIATYKEFLAGKGKNLIIENSCKHFCSMCRFKLIDFENFQKICLKTLESFEELIEYIEEPQEQSTQIIKQEPIIEVTAFAQVEENYEKEPETKIEHSDDDDEEENDLYNDDEMDQEDVEEEEQEEEIEPENLPKRRVGRPRKTDPSAQREPSPKKSTKIQKRQSRASLGDKHLETHQVQMKESVMKYGEFCKQILLKIYPKRPRKKEGHSIKLDIYCQICKSEVKPYRGHLINMHFKTLKDGYSCQICGEKVPNVNLAVSHFDEHRNFETPEQCRSCDETFTNMKIYKRHLKTHDNDHAFPCPECSNVYNCRNSLNYHIISVHLGKFICHSCYNVYEKEADYKKHWKWETNRLKKGNKKSRSYKSSKVMKQEESKTDDEAVDESIEAVDEQKEGNAAFSKDKFGLTFCTYCNENIHDYTNHLAKVHATIRDDGTFECKECLTVVAQKYNFAIHFRNFHKRFEIPKQCTYCDLHFDFCGEYNRHLLTHKEVLEEKLFVCHYCNKSYMHKQMLKHHMFNQHTNQRCCSFCSRVFEDITMYKEHMAMERANRRKQVVCDICGFSTDHKRYLRDHVIRLHSGDSVVCDECGKVCKTALNLKDHKLNVHREKKALCNICGSKFRNATFLKYHTEKYHSDSKIACNECGKQMHWSDMKRHIFFKHSVMRPFECTHCAMTFKNKSGLQKHLHTHTQTRPFNCQICSQGYYNRDLLQKHYVQAHGLNYDAKEMKEISKRMPSALEKSALERN